MQAKYATPVSSSVISEEHFDFGGLGVNWKIDGTVTNNRFAVVHHPIAPHALAAPLHRHTHEGEYSYVLYGTLGALLGDELVTANAGQWVIKPRRQWHTFWNAGDDTCEIIEIISPAGFENYFREVAAVWGNLEQFARINKKGSSHKSVQKFGHLKVSQAVV